MRFFHQAARRAAVLLLCLSMLTGMLIPAQRLRFVSGIDKMVHAILTAAGSGRTPASHTMRGRKPCAPESARVRLCRTRKISLAISRRTLYHNTQRSDFRKGTIFCMVKRKSVIWCIHG